MSSVDLNRILDSLRMVFKLIFPSVHISKLTVSKLNVSKLDVSKLTI